MRKWTIALYVSLFVSFLLFSGCKIYSFTGASLPANVTNFSVELFQNLANNGPASLGQVFTDRLKQKMQTEANLRMVPADGDLQFRGSIVGYTYTSEAPIAGATSGLNKLTISVRVEYINTKDEKDTWAENFTRFAQFSSSEDILSVENRVIEEINRQLVDDIFQRALVKW
ncbi:MAG: LptE family protein [Chitinophagales bacterium]|nr:LptE family protein [Chitinophagales bacterium]